MPVPLCLKVNACYKSIHTFCLNVTASTWPDGFFVRSSFFCPFRNNVTNTKCVSALIARLLLFGYLLVANATVIKLLLPTATEYSQLVSFYVALLICHQINGDSCVGTPLSCFASLALLVSVGNCKLNIYLTWHLSLSLSSFPSCLFSGRWRV